MLLTIVDQLRLVLRDSGGGGVFCRKNGCLMDSVAVGVAVEDNDGKGTVAGVDGDVVGDAGKLEGEVDEEVDEENGREEDSGVVVEGHRLIDFHSLMSLKEVDGDHRKQSLLNHRRLDVHSLDDILLVGIVDLKEVNLVGHLNRPWSSPHGLTSIEANERLTNRPFLSRKKKKKEKKEAETFNFSLLIGMLGSKDSKVQAVESPSSEQNQRTHDNRSTKRSRISGLPAKSPSPSASSSMAMDLVGGPFHSDRLHYLRKAASQDEDESETSSQQLQQQLDDLRSEHEQLLDRSKKSAELLAQLCNAVQEREAEIMILNQRHEEELRSLQGHATRIMELYEKCVQGHHEHRDAEQHSSESPSIDLSSLQPDALEYFQRQHPQLLTCSSCVGLVLEFQNNQIPSE